MNTAVSKNALIKRIRRAQRRWNWFLVVARGDWYQNDQHLGSYYLIDGNGNVMDHHCDLVTLAKDLGVLREGETVEGCDTPPAEMGRVTEAVEPADSIAAEVARILPFTLGRVEPIQPQVRSEVAMPASQTCPIPEVEEWEGLTDTQGRLWVSWPKVEKVRHEW